MVRAWELDILGEGSRVDEGETRMVGFAATVLASTTAQVSPSIPWVTIIYVLAALATIGGAALWVARQTRETRVRNDRFDRDWYGEPERPGVPARPGVMEQLLGLRTDVESIRAEVNYNHGGSIKDVVDETREEVRRLHERLDATTTTTTVTTVTAPDVHT